MRSVLLSLLTVWTLFLAWSVGAQVDTKEKSTPRIKFKAKRHFQDLKNNLVILEGGVHITYSDMDLHADKVSVDKKTASVKAEGNIFLKIPSEKTEINAEEIAYNYQSQKGEFKKAHIKYGFVRVWGERIKKVGDKKYIVKDGSFTTCDVEQDETCPWRVWSHKSKVTLGGYATAEHPIFFAMGIPLLYSPFIAFPVKRERQTGFLLPEFGVSDQSGVRVKNSFFLALDRGHDVTYDLEYFSKRGLKSGLEYRFALSKLSHGQINGYYISDREFNSDFGEKSRYAASLIHQLYFLPNLYNKAELRLISDDEYVKDFEKDIEGIESAGLETKLLQGFNFHNFSMNAEAVYYENLLSGRPKDTNRNETHKLPEVRAVFLPTTIFGGAFNIGAETSYVNYTNDGAKFVDKNFNSEYDDFTDQLNRAQRFDFFPTLSAPIKAGRYFEIVPSISYRQTDWWLPLGKIHKKRQMLDFNTTLKTNVGRIFNYDKKKLKKMKHVIEPTISYRYTPFIRRAIGLPKFDEIDDISMNNLFSWAIQNRFIFKFKEDDGFNYIDAIRFQFGQDINIREARSDVEDPRPFGPINSVLAIKINSLLLSNEATFPLYGNDRLTRVSTVFSYADAYSNTYKLNYTFSDEDDANTINGSIKLGFIDIMKFLFSANYSFDKEDFIEKQIKASYIPPSKCWALNMTFKDRIDQGFSFNLSLSLLLGEELLSLADITQEGDYQRFKIGAKKKDNKDIYYTE